MGDRGLGMGDGGIPIYTAVWTKVVPQKCNYFSVSDNVNWHYGQLKSLVLLD